MNRPALRLAITAALAVTVSAATVPVAAASSDVAGAGPSFTLQRLERVCTTAGGQFSEVPSASPSCADAQLHGRSLVRADTTCERLGGQYSIVALDSTSASWTCDFSAL